LTKDGDGKFIRDLSANKNLYIGGDVSLVDNKFIIKGNTSANKVHLLVSGDVSINNDLTVTNNVNIVGSGTSLKVKQGTTDLSNLKANTVTISGGSINSTTIGSNGASSGNFTTLIANDTLNVTNGATFESDVSLINSGSNLYVADTVEAKRIKLNNSGSITDISINIDTCGNINALGNLDIIGTGTIGSDLIVKGIS
jgi:hypothetical protein